MADDLTPTPADPRAFAPVAMPAPAEPKGRGCRAGASDEPTTAEIVALLVTGTGADRGAVTPPPSPTGVASGLPPRPAATNSGGPSAAVAAAMAAETGAAAAGPAAAAGAVTPLPKVSNETPTITKPKPKPRAAPVPRPAPSASSSTPPAAPAPARPPAAPRPESDWASEVADRIDEVVAKVRANTSDRLVGIARMVVYGLLAAVMGVTTLVLGLILFFRLLAVIPGPVWIPYLGLGAIFVLLGLLFWSKRTAKPAPA